MPASAARPRSPPGDDSTLAASHSPDLDLCRITGAANLDFAAIRQQAQAYCPATAAKYGNVNPTSVNRPLALQMGNACLAEMGPFSLHARPDPGRDRPRVPGMSATIAACPPPTRPPTSLARTARGRSCSHA